MLVRRAPSLIRPIVQISRVIAVAVLNPRTHNRAPFQCSLWAGPRVIDRVQGMFVYRSLRAYGTWVPGPSAAVDVRRLVVQPPSNCIQALKDKKK